MARKAGASTIGANPLDQVVPHGAGKPATAQADKAPPKRAMTVRLGEDLIERLQNAVYWTPGETLTAVLERGVAKELAAMEKAQGGPFKPAPGPIKTGRRAGG